VVLADPLASIADEAHAARREVFASAEIVEKLERARVGVERVEREIAPRGVLRASRR
jgi:hypothetical protein